MLNVRVMLCTSNFSRSLAIVLIVEVAKAELASSEIVAIDPCEDANEPTPLSSFTNGSDRLELISIFVIAQAFYPGLLCVSTKISIYHQPKWLSGARGRIIVPHSPPMRCTFKGILRGPLLGSVLPYLTRLRVSLNSPDAKPRIAT